MPRWSDDYENVLKMWKTMAIESGDADGYSVWSKRVAGGRYWLKVPWSCFHQAALSVLPDSLSYETEVMWFEGDPIWVRTLSSHCKGPSKWISIQHGVEVTSWRWYSAPQPLTKDILEEQRFPLYILYSLYILSIYYIHICGCRWLSPMFVKPLSWPKNLAYRWKI